MTPPNQDTFKAIGRLVASPDFIVLRHWLEAEQKSAVETLVFAPAKEQVHQLQGQAQVLTDILRFIRAAHPALG